MDDFIDLISDLARDRGYAVQKNGIEVIIGRERGKFRNEYTFVSDSGAIMCIVNLYLSVSSQFDNDRELRNQVYDLSEFAEQLFGMPFQFYLPGRDGNELVGISGTRFTPIGRAFEDYEFSGDDFEDADRMLDILEYKENELWRDARIAGFELHKSLEY